MCGIVGYVGSKPAVPILLNGLKALEYRGYDSAGIAVNGRTIEVVKTKGRVADLEQCLSKEPVTGSVGIGHTRWATHGKPSYLNAHPHNNANLDIAVVHNGIIENYLQLREELINKGYSFVSETDTETIVHLLEDCKAKTADFIDAVILAIGQLRGSYALAIMNRDREQEIIVVKKDSPLVIGLGQGENFIASDVPAILEYTKKVHYLEDGELAIINPDQVTILNQQKEKQIRQEHTITWSVQAAQKNGYQHYMLKEIHEQPTAIRDTLMSRLGVEDSEIQLDDVKLDQAVLDRINRIYIVACGTAYYAGCIGKELIERIAGIPVVCDVASEFRYRQPMLDEQSLMIIISQSGETADTLASLRMGKRAGAYIVSVVNVIGSTISRESDDVFYTYAGPEIAVASTKAYSTQLIAMFLLAIKIGRLKQKISDSLFRQLKIELNNLPKQVEQILAKASQVKQIAEQYLNMKNIFYIGRGLDYASSLEGALKIKEIAYLHAESYAAGELKHGPIALIEEGSTLMGLLGQEDLMEKTISNIKEVKARGASVIAIALEGNQVVDKIADSVIKVPKTSWMFTPLLINIPQQLFAYYIACGLGHDVDKPRNLAKSVTVE